jgi:NAD(P)-dependent dehydrogenase (short-subunit alcohol dehydrogenase family)
MKDDFADTADDLWWRRIDVSLGGLYNSVRAAWPHFIAQGGGHVIGVASGSSVHGYTDEGAYCAARAAGRLGRPGRTWASLRLRRPPTMDGRVSGVTSADPTKIIRHVRPKHQRS